MYNCSVYKFKLKNFLEVLAIIWIVSFLFFCVCVSCMCVYTGWSKSRWTVGVMKQVIPQLQQSNSLDFYFQQDEAPTHYSRAVWEYLDNEFFRKLIGQHMHWLNPHGFFFWEVLKDKVYSWKPKSVGDLKNYIRDAFQEINEQRGLCKKCRSMRSRFQSYVNCDGQQFEHLRW